MNLALCGLGGSCPHLCLPLRDTQALRQRLLIGGLGAREQFLDFGFELRLDLLRVSVGQRAVKRGIGVNLGAIERDHTK